MKVTPILDNILILPLEAEEKRQVDYIFPIAQKKTTKGKVVEVETRKI